MNVGQEVVCIKGAVNLNTHQHLKEGEVYIIKSITSCACSDLLHVGFSSKSGTLCKKCNTLIDDGIWWLYANRFIPLDDIDISEIIEYTQVEVLQASHHVLARKEASMVVVGEEQ